MKADTCKQILFDYLKSHPGWVKKGYLYGVLEEAEGFSPETTGRKLRLLCEEKKIHVEYYKGRKGQRLARYCHDAPVEKKLKIIVENGRAIQIYV